jgi:type VI protein secretion system component Hcp
MTRQHKNLETEAHVPAEELSDTDLEKATGGSGKVRHSDFVMVKLLDAATPKLF